MISVMQKTGPCQGSRELVQLLPPVIQVSRAFTKSMTLRIQPSILRYSNWANLPTSGIPARCTIVFHPGDILLVFEIIDYVGKRLALDR